MSAWTIYYPAYPGATVTVRVAALDSTTLAGTTVMSVDSSGMASLTIQNPDPGWNGHLLFYCDGVPDERTFGVIDLATVVNQAVGGIQIPYPDNEGIAAIRAKTDLLPAPDNAGIAAARAAAERISGGGGIPVDHDTGGADVLRYLFGANPVADAIVSAYLQSEYDAGTRILRGQSITGSDGRWTRPIYLASGTYTVTFHAHGYQTAIVRGVQV